MVRKRGWPISATNYNTHVLEHSLVDLDLAINRLKVKIKRTDHDILKEVRLQSMEGDRGRKDLQSAKKSIQVHKQGSCSDILTGAFCQNT